MPASTFTHTVATSASVDSAWAALQQPDTWAGIGPVSSVSDAEYASDGTISGFRWVANLGGKAYHGTAETTSYRAPERFELTMDNSEIGGDVIASIEGAGSGCSVTVQITFRTKGMLSAMFFPAIKTALAAGFSQQIEDLVASI